MRSLVILLKLKGGFSLWLDLKKEKMLKLIGCMFYWVY